MRALLIVLDSVGVGDAPDAGNYGDQGAATLPHILERHPELALPTLRSWGLDGILTGEEQESPIAAYGRMQELSAGKDTTTGHWELAGVILEEPFPTFKKFPTSFLEAIEAEAGVEFIGNCVASGTAVLDKLGAEHVRTAMPILYTSADSVLQIAAHEEIIPLKRLYEICRVARKHADELSIGRVIARPFLGEEGNWQRTAGRHDYSMVPPRTILNAISETGRSMEGIGKIADIFAGSGVTRNHPTASNAEGMEEITKRWSELHNGLIFANLVDFDMLHGHRRNPAGYARALEEFDQWLPSLEWEPDDLIIITADHGNDPTFPGTDHTREEVPLLVRCAGLTGSLGTRKTFADVAATLGGFFGLPEWPVGESFIEAKEAEASRFHARAHS